MTMVVEIGEAVAHREVADPLEQPAVLHHDVGQVGDGAQEALRVRLQARDGAAGQGEHPRHGLLGHYREADEGAQRRLGGPRALGGRPDDARADAREGRAMVAGGRLLQACLGLFHHRRRHRPRQVEHHLQRVHVQEGHAPDGEVHHPAHEAHDRGERLVRLHQAAGDPADLGEGGGLVELPVEQIVHVAQHVHRRGGRRGPRPGGARRAPEDLAHQVQELIRGSVLGEVVVGAGLHSPGTVAGLGAKVAGGRLVLQHPARLVAVQPGHRHVEDQQVHVLRHRLLDGLQAVPGLGDTEAGAL